MKNTQQGAKTEFFKKISSKTHAEYLKCKITSELTNLLSFP